MHITPREKWALRFVVVVLFVFGSLSANRAHAATIYVDSFSGADTTNIAGRTPDLTDATVQTWLTRAQGTGRGFPAIISNSGTSGPNGTGSAASPDGANGAAALSLASNGTFTRPATPAFTIAGDLSVNTLTGTGSGTQSRGMLLGYYSTFTNGNATTDAGVNFTGVTYNSPSAGNGQLQLVVNGTVTGAAVPVSGVVGSLSYTVNTSTGQITSLAFNGTDLTANSTFSSTTAFTNAATAFAGFGGSSSTAGTFGRIDNFSVSAIAVPEPASASLLALGAMGLLAARRRATVSR